ncbi:SMI1/KNR4 family protein [Calothrix sp. FACHB-156]|nr:SMI1/KNR4 family protein [Calothrix sp. FACHB-156]
MNLEQIYVAYLQEYGEPDYLLSVFADNQQMTPNRLDIAYRFPIEEEEKYATSIMTLGLATVRMTGAVKTAELVMDILGKYSHADYDNVGKALANLVWNHLQLGLNFAPNLIIREISIPFFEKMSCLFVMDWGHSEPEWLEGVEPSVRLLEIVPIYTSEANTLERINPNLRTRVFVESKGDWNNYKRQPVLLLQAATKNVWNKLEKWYEQNAPVVYQGLKAGASEQEIKNLENIIGIILPDDFATSLMTHNGEIEFHDYTYLTVEQIYQIWSMMNELNAENAFSSYEMAENNKGIIKDTWWDSHWIPFALDSCGNSICIDLSPGENGTVEQIIYMEKNEGPMISKYKSFFEWLWEYQQDLYRGYYRVNQDGLVEEKL